MQHPVACLLEHRPREQSIDLIVLRKQNRQPTPVRSLDACCRRPELCRSMGRHCFIALLQVLDQRQATGRLDHIAGDLPLQKVAHGTSFLGLQQQPAMGKWPGQRIGGQPIADSSGQPRIEHDVRDWAAFRRGDGGGPLIGPDLGAEITEIVGDGLARRPLRDRQIDDTPGQRQCRRHDRHPGSCRQRQLEGEQRSLAEARAHGDAASHALDEPPRDRQAEAGPGSAPVGILTALLIHLEDPVMIFERNPWAGVMDVETNGPALPGDPDQHPAAIGELHRIPDQIEQNLPKPVAVADDLVRQARGDIGCDLDILGMGPRRHELADRLDGFDQIERPLVDFEPPGFDFGGIEYLVENRQQRPPRSVDRHGIGPLLRCEVGLEQQAGHADDPVHRRAYLVAHGGEELAFGPARRFGLRARLLQRRDRALQPQEPTPHGTPQQGQCNERIESARQCCRSDGNDQLRLRPVLER